MKPLSRLFGRITFVQMLFVLVGLGSLLIMVNVVSMIQRDGTSAGIHANFASVTGSNALQQKTAPPPPYNVIGDRREFNFFPGEFEKRETKSVGIAIQDAKVEESPVGIVESGEDGTADTSSGPVFVVQGFNDAKDFLSKYDVQRGPLFILLMSNADAESGEYWCPDCQRAKKPVLDAMSRAPNGTNLLEVRVGSREEWKNDMNSFRQNELFYVDYIPSLLKWEGDGKTSRILSEADCTNAELLDYMFMYDVMEPPPSSSIVTLRKYSEVVTWLDSYENDYPLFIFMISDIDKSNGRLWCPYCDRTEIPVQFYFSKFATDNSKLLRVMVAKSLKDLRDANNEFRKSDIFTIRGVPILMRIHKNDKRKVVHRTWTKDLNSQLKVFFSKPEEQFVKEFPSPAAVKGTTLLTRENDLSLITKRKTQVQGFKEAAEYLKKYDIQNGPLYVLLMSNKEPETGAYWCPDCEKASVPVNSAFERAPNNTRLVEIHVGTKSEWKDEWNPFRIEDMFYIDYIPALFKWEGDGKSSNLLSEKNCLDDNLLDYVFNVDEENLKAPAASPSSSMLEIRKYADLMALLTSYENDYPLFVFFISDVYEPNGRMWCPYCDRAEVAVNYYFNQTAGHHSKLIHAVVAKDYDSWKNPSNEFRNREIFSVEGIPHLARVFKSDSNEITARRYPSSFDNSVALKAFFSKETEASTKSIKQ